MPRYLLFFSYIGSRYCGLQKQPGVRTVQSIIEEALLNLRPSNEICLNISSRTDSGVHALCTSADVDLIHKSHPNNVYNPNGITVCLNKHFNKNEEDIRILKTYSVPDDFSARFMALRRTYLYRLCIVKDTSSAGIKQFKDYACGSIRSIFDMKRCWMISEPFDINLFKEASQLFVGDHNFASFMNNSNENHIINPLRSVHSITVRQSEGMFNKYDPYSEYFEYWDIFFQGRSFLYRQVRKMVSALVAVAQCNLEINDIKWMLDNPAILNWKSVALAPAHGLYLVNVEYDTNFLSSK